MTGKLAGGSHLPNGAAQGPGDYDILVLDASMKQSLASVRSLGKAGLRVAAGESSAQFGSRRPRADVPVPLLPAQPRAARPRSATRPRSSRR